MLSPREKKAAVITLAALGLWAADWLLLSPYLERSGALSARADDLRLQLQSANNAFNVRRRLGRVWNESGARELPASGTQAETQSLHAVRDWAQECGLSLTAVKPERAEEAQQFGRMGYRLTAAGKTAAVAQFLLRFETTKIPVRIGDIQISARKEGEDDLVMQLGFSTLHALAREVTPSLPTPSTPAVESRAGTASGGGGL